MRSRLLMRGLPALTAAATVVFLVSSGQPSTARPRHRHPDSRYLDPARVRARARQGPAVEEAADQGAQGGAREDAQELFAAEP